MSLYDAIDARFSCRAYTNQPLDQTDLDDLTSYAAELSQASGLRFVVVGPEDGGGALKLSKRMFAGKVSTYVALVGPDDNPTRERLGYFGEKLVLHATELGLGTCWVAGTFDRESVSVALAEGEVLHGVIPVGYLPDKQPFAQRTIRAGLRKRDKKPEALYKGFVRLGSAPAWVQAGIEAVAKGPSAVNQQPVVFVQDQGRLHTSLPNHKNDLEYTDLGIAKLHFELGAEAAGMPGTWEWGASGRYIF